MTDEERIARVAQAFCKADGHDPEEHIYVGSEVIETAGADHYREIMGAAWTAYIGEARRFVAAAKAAGMLE